MQGGGGQRREGVGLGKGKEATEGVSERERGLLGGGGSGRGLEGEGLRVGLTSMGLTVLPPTHTCQAGWGRGLTHLAASLLGFH